MANEPVPAPATAPPAPRKAVALRITKSPPGSPPMSAADRLKEYLKDVPGLHARLKKAVEDAEANNALSKKTLAEFETTVTGIKALVAKWEQEEQTHVHGEHAAPAQPRVDAAGSASAAGAAPVTPPDSGGSKAAPEEAGAAPGGPVPQNAC